RFSPDRVAIAARKIVWGAMAWGGQWCTSPGYAYVLESVADQFVAEAKRALVEMFGTDPKNNPDYSRIIGTSHTPVFAQQYARRVRNCLAPCKPFIVSLASRKLAFGIEASLASRRQR